MPAPAHLCPRCSAPLMGDTAVCATCTELGETVGYTPEGVAPGEVPPGYESVRELGQGGMGVVYLARQTALKRLVALKMIRGEGVQAAQRERFQAEAEAVARVTHPHIVQVYEVGEHRGVPYLVLEYCPGGSLAERLRTHRPAVREAAELTRTLARAVAAAHEAGIVHRDLKPGNVLFAKDDSLRVADFGLAKELDADHARTATGTIVGTPAYMAPEQASGVRVGPACDIWASGVILYEMLTGQVPFRGATVAQTLDRVRTAEPVAPRKLNASIPRDLETICLKCLEKEPARRYASAPELAADLTRFLDFEPILARRAGLVERFVRGVRRRPALALGVLLLLVLVGGGLGAWWLWQRVGQAEQEANAESVEYYTALTRRHGAPEGVGPRTEAEAQAMPRVYRFTRRGKRVVLVERVLVSHDRENPTAPASWFRLVEAPGVFRDEKVFRFEYDESGRVRSETGADAWGHVLWTLRYTGAETAYLADQRSGLLQGHLAASYQLRLTWDEDGRIRRAVCVDDAGTPRRVAAGFAGVALRYDARGLATRREYLDLDSMGSLVPLRDPQRRAVVAEYDDLGRPLRMAHFDADGKPAADHDGIHAWTIRYRADAEERRFFGPDSKPTRVKGTGPEVAVQRVLPGARPGEVLLEETGLDGADQPAPTDGKTVYRSTCTLRAEGVPRELMTYDREGRPVRLGTELVPSGYDRMTVAYDNHGSRTGYTMWLTVGATSVPVLELDRQDAPVRVWCRDPEGRPVDDPQSGVHLQVFEHDAARKPTLNEHFDRHERPVLHKHHGYHRRTARYDETGMLLAEAFFGVQGEPIRSPISGAHRTTLAYDDQKRVTVATNYGTDGKPCVAAQGFAQVRHTYRDAGRDPVETLHSIPGPGGTLVPRQRRGPKAFVFEEWYHDAAGNPILDPQAKVHRRVNVPDANGQVRESRVFGLKGERIVDALYGVHRIVRESSPDGSASESYFGTDERPMPSKAGPARVTVTVTGGVKESTWWRWTADDEYRIWRRFNGRNQPTEEIHFDLFGTPALHPMIGAHRMLMSYTESGLPREVTFFGLKNEPVVHKVTGVHRAVTSYVPGTTRPNENTCFDTAGKPAVCKEGFHRRVYQYNLLGQPAGYTDYDAAGAKIAPKPPTMKDTPGDKP